MCYLSLPLPLPLSLSLSLSLSLFLFLGSNSGLYTNLGTNRKTSPRAISSETNRTFFGYSLLYSLCFTGFLYLLGPILCYRLIMVFACAFYFSPTFIFADCLFHLLILFLRIYFSFSVFTLSFFS